MKVKTGLPAHRDKAWKNSAQPCTAKEQDENSKIVKSRKK
jgi:hypothetical protein